MPMVRLIVRARSGYTLADIQKDILEDDWFGQEYGDLVYTNYRREFNHLVDTEKSCLVHLFYHEDYFRSSNRPLYQAVWNGLTLAPFSAILVDVFETWWQTSSHDGDEACRRVLQIARLMVRYHDNLAHVACGQSSLLSGKIRALRFYVQEIFCVLPHERVMDRMIALKLLTEEVADHVRQAPYQTTPSPPRFRQSEPSPDSSRTPPDVAEAAFHAIRILRQLGFRVAIFGSLACWAYGASRKPKDVDLLILRPQRFAVMDEDYIKRRLVRADPSRFYLRNARTPGAHWKVLHYRLSEVYDRRTCKVDILLPGTMHLPDLPSDLIIKIGPYPVIPFSVLLLQKLQSWDDNRRSSEAYRQDKQHQDARDIKVLLRLGPMAWLKQVRPWNDRTLFSRRFMELSKQRVKDFCLEYYKPQIRKSWEELGFDTESHFAVGIAIAH